MTITINRRTSSELKERRKDILTTFQQAGYATEGAPISKRDIRDLAVLGVLSTAERSLYDELARIEALLD